MPEMIAAPLWVKDHSHSYIFVIFFSDFCPKWEWGGIKTSFHRYNGVSVG